MSQCLGTYDLRCLLGDLIFFLLGDEYLERCAWGCGVQGLLGDLILFCLGMNISAALLLGDLLGVDLLGSLRQGCIRVSRLIMKKCIISK